VAAPSNSWVCSRSLARIVVLNMTRGGGCLSLVSVIFGQVELLATRRSLVQRSPTACGVSKCGLETSARRRYWPTGVVEPWTEKIFLDYKRGSGCNEVC
jgi:hypothetical protein